ncbi:MAG: segregation/condensation protein A [Gemmatimonadetes bacterium]|nr:segregation/condensation protein A [Gemmatimonadota bacterium]
MTAPAAEFDNTFVVDLSQFQGPLDLLLGLIRDEKVDIYDIPISRIADQFLARISTLGLDQAADYLEMAARLLRIKAQLLLPRNEHDEAWEDPRAELVRRLLEYQQMREVVDVLEKLAEERRARFARAYIPPSGAEPPPSPARPVARRAAIGDRSRVARGEGPGGARCHSARPRCGRRDRHRARCPPAAGTCALARRGAAGRRAVGDSFGTPGAPRAGAPWRTQTQAGESVRQRVHHS